MNETPVDPFPLVEEYPVLEPDLFLLRRDNRLFLERYSKQPILDKPAAIKRDTNKMAVGISITVAILVLIGIAFLPSYLSAPLLIATVLGGIGALFWAYLRYMLRPVNLKGRTISGIVTHSEKIRVAEDRYNRDYLGIRFEFTDPSGGIKEGYVEGDSDHASDKMAPAPGTPVKVWYDDDGKFYLL